MAETQSFDVSFKKVPGTLTLTPTHVAWVPSTPGTMDRQQQALGRVISAYRGRARASREWGAEEQGRWSAERGAEMEARRIVLRSSPPRPLLPRSCSAPSSTH